MTRMKLLSVSWLFLSFLELHLVNGAIIDSSLKNGKRTPIDYDLYLRDLSHDEVPPLHHLLAIRDEPAHVPISNTRVTPGMLLDHILDTNPTLKPVKSERMGKFQFDRYTFNHSVWNGGLAEMLSHAPVRTVVKLSDLKNSNTTAEGETRVTKRLPGNIPRKRAVMSEFNDIQSFFDTTDGTAFPPPPRDPESTKEGGVQFVKLKPTYMARCFADKGKYVYAKLSDLREISDFYCTIFDANMYKMARGMSIDDLGEFSLGTIYKAVKLEGSRTMRVNFQFIYQPKGFEGGKYWYPMSLFTGIQGVCHRVMRNFLSVPTAMSGCVGGAGDDTRGGWMGMDIGSWSDNRMVFRWAIDPYVRYSKEHNYPDPMPEGEVNNGLSRTNPKEIYQPK
ncbi:hypothetical protein TWF679_008885 [Orbilia oligospora]|uniref:Uncharacterized protein n=1 Tax=Orbilia oligospora TaxID=2813651 RepID=A0A8H8VJS3_ORBOL|nr:hypothetical protein TWF679_008885 [Orbilia oligospora]